ncbi:K(+)-transporting ATPase subunit F [Streptomyces griseoluteus]
MTADNILGLVVAAVVIYLVVALIHPERFRGGPSAYGQPAGAVPGGRARALAPAAR